MIEVLLLMTAQATSIPAATPQQEIVVIGRRLNKWRGKVSGTATGSRCKTTKSTGDRDLDKIACDSLRYCIAIAQPEFQAISKVAAAQRSRLLDEVNRKLANCGEEQHQTRVADLVEQRWRNSSKLDGDR